MPKRPTSSRKSATSASTPRRTAPQRRAVQAAARAEARDVYRTSIIEAAARVFARRGFHDTKVADIAKEAGLAAGTLYNYFDSKEVIFRSLVELRGAQALDEARAIVAAPGEPLERLARYVRWMFEHVERNASTFQAYAQMGVNAEWQLKRVGDCATQNYMNHLALLESLIADAQRTGALRQDVALGDMVAAIAGPLNSHIHQWLVSNQRESLASRATRTLDLFLKGASHP